MLSDLISTYGERLIIAVVGVGMAFIALIAVLWLVRRRGGPAPFLKGGKNRQPRLQVLDATAVDARRRLVLVRRDNVEHLIMIGGPTDIVVESGIGAIPIVTDITQNNNARLEDLSPDLPSRQEPSLSQPAPSITPEKQKPAAPVKLEPQPEPIIPPAKNDVPAAPVVAPQRTILPNQTAQAPTPVVAPKALQRTETNAAIPLAAQQKTAPEVRDDTVKPSSPLTTSAMRPRSTSAVSSQQRDPSAAAATNTPAAASATSARAVMATTMSATATAAPIVSSEPQYSLPAQTTAARVDDIFDAARERVLPDLVSPDKDRPQDAVKADSQETAPSFDDSFSIELRDDFESFLNAEIEKTSQNNASQATIEPFKLEGVNKPITGASVDTDAQKEMARIFGEMAVKRD